MCPAGTFVALHLGLFFIFVWYHIVDRSWYRQADSSSIDGVFLGALFVEASHPFSDRSFVVGFFAGCAAPGVDITVLQQ